MTAPAAPMSNPRGLGLADFCIRRPVFATMINLLFVVLGWMAFRDLGIDQGEKTLGEMLPEAPGKEVYMKISHRPDGGWLT